MIRIRTNRDLLYINCHINKGNTVSFCVMTHFYLRLRLHTFVANVRCYGYYYHNVFFALTATILFRK